MGSYWNPVLIAFRSLSKGLSLTLNHLWKARKSRKQNSIQQPGYFDQSTGIATLQYPHEHLPMPVTGRYRLHNEIEDCIVCDKCVKVCPVNCITIDPIRSAEPLGKTSDGSVKRIHAAKFDIDMGQCCFCGLCTTVCPTECLTMTPVFDFSTYNIDNHTFSFATMTEAEAMEKRKAWEEHQQSKPTISTPSQAAAKPVFKPKIKPPPGSSL